jgi:hypothetical protein
MSALKRDPQAFRPKVKEMPDRAAAAVVLARASAGTVDDGSSSTAATKGCNCRKSLCLKVSFWVRSEDTHAHEMQKDLNW